jgi:uncharacterized protein with beta-barrel porin domain
MKQRLRTTVAAIALLPLAFAALGGAEAQETDLYSFGVLAASGITGIGSIDGNVGIAPGFAAAITDLTPIMVTGEIYAADDLPANGIAAAAQAELTAAYLVYAGMATLPSTTNMISPELGGLTLTSGTYNFAATAQISTGATLTLDGQGNPNSTFIIIVGSGLDVLANASVSLINGAQGANVYWVVGSTAALFSDVDFAGQILAHTSVTLGANASITCGAAWANIAEVTLLNNVIIAPRQEVCAFVDESIGDVIEDVEDATPDADAVGDALDDYLENVGDLPDALQDLIDFLSPEDLADVLDQLSGEVATGVAPTGMQAMNSFLSLMLGSWTNDAPRSAPGVVTVKALGYADERAPRQFPSFDQPGSEVGGEPRHWDMWGAIFGSFNNTQSMSIGGHDRWGQAYGIASGFDYRVSPDTRVGLSLAGGGTDFGLSDNRGSGHSDMLQTGIYARSNVGVGYVAAALAYAWHGVTTNRTVTIPAPISVTEELTATFNAHNVAGHIEAGVRLGWFIPYGALRQQIFYTPAYTETAVGDSTADFALDYLENTATVTRTEIGVRVEKAILADGADSSLTLRGRFAWAHDYWSDPGVRARFHSTPDMEPWVVEGVSPPTDSILVSAGAEFGFAYGLTLAAWFDGEFAEGSQTYAGTGKLTFAW